MNSTKHITPVNVLVIGAGMYVCGKGINSYGTVLPALFQAKKDGWINSISIVGTKPENKKYLDAKIRELNTKMNTNIKVEYFPKGNKSDKKAYEKVIESTDRTYCAIVAVPDQLHFNITRKLIENGIHTLVVKPLSAKIVEVKKLVELQKQNNVYCAVEFHKRFDEGNLKIREMINNNKIGDVLYWLAEFSQRNTVPKIHFKDWVEHTNIFQYLGVHYVDIIYYCTKFLPYRVMAIGQKNFLVNNGIDTYDAIQALIEWKDNFSEKRFVSAIFTNWIDPTSSSAMSDQKIKVIGSLGRIESDQKNRGLKITTEAKGIEDINPYFSEFYDDIAGDSMNFSGYGCKSIVQFIKDSYSIINKSKNPKELKGLRATFEEALISTAVIEAVNLSLRKGNRWINVYL